MPCNRRGSRNGARPKSKKAPHSGAFFVFLPDRADQLPVALSTLIDTPGPMVDEIETFFM